MHLHFDGLSVAEAAKREGVSMSALKVRAHRGYRALRHLLGETA
jgi:DNA-directed RNA polymerase specialized sigma24 family protein